MIIGFVGYKQSGKSTASEYLKKNHKFKGINFKDGLVSELKQNFPDLLRELSIIYSMTIDELFQNKPSAMRALMQNYGTDVRRKDNNDYWVRQWELTARNTTGNIVADDVRFINEADAIKLREGVIIRVERPDVISTDTHESETEQLRIEEDFVIKAATGEHESFYKQLESIIETIKSNVD